MTGSIGVALLAAALSASGPSPAATTPVPTLTVPKVEYLGGAPNLVGQCHGWLRLEPARIVFGARERDFLSIEGARVTMVVAGASGDMQEFETLRTVMEVVDRVELGTWAYSVTQVLSLAKASEWLGVVSLASSVLAFASVPVMLSREEPRHFLGVVYTGEDEQAHLALFDVQDHAARAVKKMIDLRVGKTPEFYAAQRAAARLARARAETSAAVAGDLIAAVTTVVGDRKPARGLVAPGAYEVLLLDGYVGLRPAGAERVKYRLRVREEKHRSDRVDRLQFVTKGARVVGFRFAQTEYRLY